VHRFWCWYTPLCDFHVSRTSIIYMLYIPWRTNLKGTSWLEWKSVNRIHVRLVRFWWFTFYLLLLSLELWNCKDTFLVGIEIVRTCTLAWAVRKKRIHVNVPLSFELDFLLTHIPTFFEKINCSHTI
jgi:hypothetical protein